MTAWASMLVPAGSVVVGAVIAGGAAVGGQVLTHRGNFQRERAARREAFKITRFETERETLLSLQAALLEHLELVLKVQNAAEVQQWERVENRVDEVVRSDLKILTLTSRCLAREAVEAVDRFRRRSHSATTNLGEPVSIAVEFKKAQDLLGLALRQDPFEGDH
ncbi:hypothetical protein ACRYCC_26520 [Actinomadura scrupuli]|uniref:hypothetical protein n=1 Tax=Actinomadura scrupuli TaxID=559629 RepID=UPI003D97A9DF